MYDLGCMCVDESRPFVVLDGLPGLYGLKYESATASWAAIVLVILQIERFCHTLEAWTEGPEKLGD